MGSGVTWEDNRNEELPPYVYDSRGLDAVSWDINDITFIYADMSQNKLIEHFDMLFKTHKIKWTRQVHIMLINS